MYALDHKPPDAVAKAIMALPWQALLVLLLVRAVQGHSSLLACPILPIGVHGPPEGMGPDAGDLPDQPVQRLHLQHPSQGFESSIFFRVNLAFL